MRFCDLLGDLPVIVPYATEFFSLIGNSCNDQLEKRELSEANECNAYRRDVNRINEVVRLASPRDMLLSVKSDWTTGSALVTIKILHKRKKGAGRTLFADKNLGRQIATTDLFSLQESWEAV